MLKVNLSNEIILKIGNNELKAIDLIKYIFDNIPNAETKKDLNKTNLREIIIDGKNIKNAMIDMYKRTLNLSF